MCTGAHEACVRAEPGRGGNHARQPALPSVTGLTWSHYAGERFGQLLDAVKGHTPELDTTLPGAEPPAGDEGGEHAGHGVAGESAAADPADFDAALAVARDAGLGGTVEVTPPADSSRAWVVAQKDNVWPVHYDQVAVDSEKAEVTSRTRWADYPLPAKLSKLGVGGHMGVLFGIVNQIVLAVVALGLTAVSIWGYRMWWQRRPTRDDRGAALGKAPARGVWRRLPLPVLILGIPAVAALGWRCRSSGSPWPGSSSWMWWRVLSGGPEPRSRSGRARTTRPLPLLG